MNQARPKLVVERPHSARIYDYWLGGKDNYAADRDAADAVLRELPWVRTACRENRAFMHRAARAMVAAGIDQFIDIGTGIPTAPNLHQIVQEARPSAHVVYVDHDPVVLAHAAALMKGDPRGRTAYVQADARNPQALLEAPDLRTVIDFGRPVGVTMLALLHFLPDDDQAARLVARIVEAIPAGSQVAITHATGDLDPVATARGQETYRASGVPFRLRSKVEVEQLFTGLDLLEPGVVMAHRWHAKPSVADREVSAYGGVARKA